MGWIAYIVVAPEVLEESSSGISLPAAVAVYWDSLQSSLGKEAAGVAATSAC